MTPERVEQLQRHIVEEAQRAGLLYESGETFRSGERASNVENGFRLFFGGSFPIDQTVVLRFRMPSGEPWIFVQPISGHYPMCGEHYVVVPRAPEAPTFAKGLSSFWQRPQRRLRLALGALLSLFLFPIFPLTIALTAVATFAPHLLRPRRFESVDQGHFASRLSASPALKGALQKLPVEWKFSAVSSAHPWVFQWTSLGQGQGMLVIPADSGPAGFLRVLGFAQALVQGVPQIDAPPSLAAEAPRYFDLAWRSLVQSQPPPALARGQ